MKVLMSNKDYHAHEAVGSSILKKIASKTILHALSEEFKETDALKLGSAVHAAILEPETFKNEFIVAPKVDKRTKAGKEVWASFLELAEGKTLLTEDQKEACEQMKKSVLSHPIAGKMLSGGEAEYSYFVKDQKTGLEKKCRPDYFCANALIDLKTCRDASYEGFLRDCINLKYHVQAAYYVDIFNEATGSDLNEFFFACVENTAPYAVNIFRIGEVELELGRAQYRKALDEYALYLKEKRELSAYGYEPKISTLEYPVYALMKEEVVA